MRLEIPLCKENVMNQALLANLTLDAPSAMKVEQYLPDEKTLLSLADLFSVLADRTRLKILSALSITPMCVGDISLLLGINQTTVSHQLKTLRSFGFVEFKRSGKVIFYSIAENKVEGIFSSAADFMLTKSN